MTKTVLTVEDSPAIRQVIVHTLSGAGYEVIEAGDGVAGLEKARGAAVNLILTDQNMPRMDGIAMIRELRQLPEHAETPILMLTTESSGEIRERGRQAGANGWILKPFEPQRLLEAIHKVIG